MIKRLFILSMSFSLVTVNFGLSTANDMSSFIQEHQTNGIRYVSGGVGTKERAVLEEMAKDYNLKLVFAKISGDYLSDIEVDIHDEYGNSLIDTTANGPWFFADLPQGRYGVIVNYKNQRKFRSVEVAERLQTIMFHWSL